MQCVFLAVSTHSVTRSVAVLLTLVQLPAFLCFCLLPYRIASALVACIRAINSSIISIDPAIYATKCVRYKSKRPEITLLLLRSVQTHGELFVQGRHGGGEALERGGAPVPVERVDDAAGARPEGRRADARQRVPRSACSC